MPATLHIDTGREMRGGQWQAFYLLRALAATGEHAALLAPESSPLLERARAHGMDARPLRIRELLSVAQRFDLVHAHDARAHTLGTILKRPLVVSRRVAFPVKSSAASRWKYRRATRFIAVSQFVKRILVEAGIPDRAIDVVYDGVPLPPAPVYEGRSRVAALDSADPGKGKNLIVDASQRAGVEISFARDFASGFVASTALFVYITESEGLGSAALLAMAAGIPVLASHVGGLPEIVRDGVTGILTSNSPQQIADNMGKLVHDPALLERLGRNARASVEQEFTTEHMAAQTMRVYEKVLA